MSHSVINIEVKKKQKTVDLDQRLSGTEGLRAKHMSKKLWMKCGGVTFLLETTAEN